MGFGGNESGNEVEFMLRICILCLYLGKGFLQGRNMFGFHSLQEVLVGKYGFWEC